MRSKNEEGSGVWYSENNSGFFMSKATPPTISPNPTGKISPEPEKKSCEISPEPEKKSGKLSPNPMVRLLQLEEKLQCTDDRRPPQLFTSDISSSEATPCPVKGLSK
jgi:hypothetical protein